MKFIIYLITNLINGKQYVGKTKNSIEKRFADHKSAGSNCKALKRAIKKYGDENFKIEIIEYCASWDALVEAEHRNILKYKSLTPNGYNIILETAQGRIWTEKMKEKSSKNMQGRASTANTKSKFLGVRPDKKKWSCRIRFPRLGKSISKGYDSEIEAAKMYDRLAIYLFGKNAIINFPENLYDYLNEDLQSFYNIHISRSPTTSNFNGVYLRKEMNKWMAEVRFEGKQVSLGTFDSEEGAARMYDICYIYLNKKYDKLNFPEKSDEYNSLDLQSIFSSRVALKGKKNPYPGVYPRQGKYDVQYRDENGKGRSKTFSEENEAIAFKKSIKLKRPRRSWKIVTDKQ